MGEKKKMIDWKRAVKDRVPCYFWDRERPEKPDVERLVGYFPESDDYRHFTTDGGELYEHCELILDSDKEDWDEMYEALKNFVEINTLNDQSAHFYHDLDKCYEKAKKALAKAEGK